MLVKHLPPEAATATALRVDVLNAPDEPELELGRHDVETEQWSRGEQLIASVRDELHVLRWLYEHAHSGKRPKWEPEQIKRPGLKPTKKKTALTVDQTSVLAAHLARTQANGETTYN